MKNRLFVAAFVGTVGCASISANPGSSEQMLRYTDQVFKLLAYRDGNPNLEADEFVLWEKQMNALTPTQISQLCSDFPWIEGMYAVD